MRNDARESRSRLRRSGADGPADGAHILKATCDEEEVRVYDVRKERIALLVAFGASQAFSLVDVARPGGIVFTMVSSDQALLQVALSEGGLLSHCGPKGIHLSLSTISPEVACQIARLYARCATSGRPGTVARTWHSVPSYHCFFQGK